MRELAQEELSDLDRRARSAARRDQGPARSRRIPTTRRTSCSKSAPARAATRRRCSPATCSACTRATPSGRAGRSRCCHMSESGGGGIKEVDRAHRGPQRLQPAEVRERRAPRPARAGDRGERPHPHVDGHGGGAAGSRGSRHPDRREGPAHRHVLLERSRRPERQHDLLRRAHHPHPDRHWSCRSRTRSRRSRTARRR